MKAKKSKVNRKIDECQIQETPSSKDNYLRLSIVKKTPKKEKKSLL